MSRYIYLSPESFVTTALMEAASVADVQGKSLRIKITEMQDGDGISWKVGEGMWTPPYICGIVDPYRDNSKENK